MKTEHAAKLRLLLVSTILPIIFGSSHVVGQTLTVGLPSPHDPYGVPFYVAEAKGFFGNLKIEYKLHKGGSEVVKQVGNGSVDIGFAQPTEVMLKYMSDKMELPPIRYWYMLETKSGNKIAVPETSAIKSVADLKGKIVGVSAQTASNVAQFKGIAKLAGLNPDSDVIWRAVGHGAPHFQALKAGSIDASATNTTRQAAYVFNGVPLRELPDPVSDKLFGNGLFSSIQNLKDAAKVDQFTKVAVGIARAVEFCQQHENDCMDVVVARFPELIPTNMTADESRRYMISQFAARMVSLQLTADQKGIPGIFPSQAWQDYLNFMNVTEGIDKNMDVSSLFTNEIAIRANALRLGQ